MAYILSQIEKRVKKNIRINNPFNKGEKVLIIDNSTKESFLTLYLLKKITAGLRLEITVRKQKTLELAENDDKFDKIVLPIDADDVIDSFLAEICENKKMAKLSSKVMIFLEPILDKEVNEAVKRLKKDGKYEDKMSNPLDSLDQRYPGSKFAFLKSLNFLRHLK